MNCLGVPPNARKARMDAIGWSEFSATKVPTFSLTALEGRGEIAGISRLHPQSSVHIFTLPSFNAHAGCRRAGRNLLQVGPQAVLASQAVGNVLVNGGFLCYTVLHRTVSGTLDYQTAQTSPFDLQTAAASRAHPVLCYVAV